MSKLLIILFLMLTGCTATKIVKVPVSMPMSAIKIPDFPELPIASLNDKSHYDVIAKSYVASFYLVVKDDKQLRKLICIQSSCT